MQRLKRRFDFVSIFRYTIRKEDKMELSVETYNVIYCGVCVLLGAAFCFFGYKLLRLLMAAAGFVAGFSLGKMYIETTSETTTLLICILVGLAGAALMYFVYSIGVFAAGAGMGASIAKIVLPMLAIPQGGGFAIVLTIVLGLLGGILALVIKRTIIIISTAFVGAEVTVNGVVMIATGSAASLDISSAEKMLDGLKSISITDKDVYFVAAIALAVVGILVQYFKTAAKK